MGMAFKNIEYMNGGVLKISAVRLYKKQTIRSIELYTTTFRGGGSSYTFGYRRTAEIFKTPPFIYSIFLKTIPINIYFR